MNKKLLGQIVSAAAVLFAVLAVVFSLALVGAVAKVGPLTTTIKGADLIFGTGKGSLDLKFNFVGFMAIILVVAGGALAGLAILPKFGKLGLIGLILMAVAGILFFLTLALAPDAKNLANAGFKLGIGPILAGIFAFVGAACAGVRAFVIK